MGAILIDDVNLYTRHDLAVLHDALTSVHHPQAPFGNVQLIVAGDFMGLGANEYVFRLPPFIDRFKNEGKLPAPRRLTHRYHIHTREMATFLDNLREHGADRGRIAFCADIEARKEMVRETLMQCCQGDRKINSQDLADDEWMEKW